MSKLAQKIAGFLAKYAVVRPDYEPDSEDESERFTSPDASILFAAQKILEKYPALPKGFSANSSWESGGYAPYLDQQGKALHDEIVQECNTMRKIKNQDIANFLERWDLTPTQGAKVLMIQKSKMSEYLYDTSERKLPDYISSHIETFNELADSKAKKLIQKRVAKR